MKKLILLAFISFLIFIKVQDLNANGLRLINEINDISINKSQKTLEISGWGFIHNAQNFYNSTTHSYTITLKSKNDTITINGINTNISHTNTMYYIGSGYCRDNQFNLDATVCNNYYNNIGFKFSIPLSRFKMDEDYVASITVHAKTAKISKSTEVYFSNNDILKLSDGHNHYLVETRLYDTGVLVLNSNVFARETAGKNGKIIQNNLYCTTNRNTYFKPDSRFRRIANKRLINNTTYYQVKGKFDGCHKSLAVVAEGNILSSMWIASNFIEHIGEPLTIKTRQINNPPIIKVGVHPIIYVGDKINIMDLVSAYDEEDGNISHKIKVESNNFIDSPGNYQIQFSVTDSFGASSFANKNITVLRHNYPPVIHAEDRKIRQFSQFNPYDGVSAFDQDSSDITSRLKYTGEVDTNEVGQYNICYTVIDKYNLSNSKCVNIEVERANTKYRLISIKKPFYQENIPKIWESKYNFLKEELVNEIIYKELRINK